MAEGLEFRRIAALTGGKSFKENVPRLLREHEIERVEDRLHEDCRGLKLVRDVINREVYLDTYTHNAFIPPFLRSTSYSLPVKLERVEEVAKGIQEGIILRWRDGTSLREISCEVRPTFGRVEGEKTLLLTPPMIVYDPSKTARISCMDPRCGSPESTDLIRSLGLSPTRTFFITMVKGEVQEIAIDPSAAVRYVGIANVVLYSGKNDKDNVIDTFGGRLEEEMLNWLMPM